MSHTLFSPRRALVTGTSSGFGRFIAQVLANSGHVVFAGVRDANGRNAAAFADLKAWRGEHGATVTPVELGATSEASVNACAAAVDAAGGVDSAGQSAGVAATGLVETFSTQAALELLAEGWRSGLKALGSHTVFVQPGTLPTTSILANLVPADDPERATAHGRVTNAANPLFAGIGALVEARQAPTPQLASDAVFAPNAPVRVVVDASGFDGAARVNAACDSVQADLLGRFGMTGLEIVSRRT